MEIGRYKIMIQIFANAKIKQFQNVCWFNDEYVTGPREMISGLISGASEPQNCPHLELKPQSVCLAFKSVMTRNLFSAVFWIGSFTFDKDQWDLSVIRYHFSQYILIQTIPRFSSNKDTFRQFVVCENWICLVLRCELPEHNITHTLPGYIFGSVICRWVARSNNSLVAMMLLFRMQFLLNLEIHLFSYQMPAVTIYASSSINVLLVRVFR